MDSFSEVIRKQEQLISENVAGGGDESQDGDYQNALQRTEQWFIDRRGLCTGSGNGKLMSCDRSAAKYEWGRPEKTVALGKTALKYIYEKAMERKEKKVIEMPDIIQFKYGRTAEPVIAEMLIEKMADKKLEFIEQPFLKVPGYEDKLGASPDGLAYLFDQKEKIGGEIKAAMNWGTLYERVIEAIDQSHKDWWQLQTEILALQVKKLLYVTAHPPKSVFDFLNAETRDEQREMLGDIEIIEVHASPIHQNELKKRAVLCRQIGDLFLDGMGFGQAVQKAVTEFEIERFEA